jgi:iron complex outermembrane receptor protein
LEFEVTASPSDHWDLSFSTGLNNAKLKSTVTSTDTAGVTTVISGIKSGNRLPSVPRVQGSASITYGWALSTGSRAFIGGSYQYVGSRYTQIDDLKPGIGTVDIANWPGNTNGGQPPNRNAIGGPLTQTTFTFNPLLPAYTLLNLRVGLTRASWEAAVFLNNLTDERALLALDRERGLRARVGYLTNQPRTMGVTLRFNY